MAKKNYKALLKDITTLVFDVDGVLTDSSVLVTSDGEMLRKMNTRDGFALKVAVDAGLNVCIISGGSNEGVRKRLETFETVRNRSQVDFGSIDSIRCFV